MVNKNIINRFEIDESQEKIFDKKTGLLWDLDWNKSGVIESSINKIEDYIAKEFKDTKYVEKLTDLLPNVKNFETLYLNGKLNFDFLRDNGFKFSFDEVNEIDKQFYPRKVTLLFYTREYTSDFSILDRGESFGWITKDGDSRHSNGPLVRGAYIVDCKKLDFN